MEQGVYNQVRLEYVIIRINEIEIDLKFKRYKTPFVREFREQELKSLREEFDRRKELGDKIWT